MATARNGRACLIPLVPRLSFGTRLASGWIRRRLHEAMQPRKHQDYVGQASRLYRRSRQTPTALPDHQSLLTTHGVLYLTGLNRRRGFESPQVAARVPPPEFEHAMILMCLPAKSAPCADQ